MLIHVSVAAMNLLLEEVASQLPTGTHAAMLIDNAGRHTANDLRVLPKITLVHLPPYSPELNAIEKVWQYLRDRHLSGRLFNSTRSIVDAYCTAWNSLIAETGRIRSLTDFDRAQPVNPWCAGYQCRSSLKILRRWPSLKRHRVFLPRAPRVGKLPAVQLQPEPPRSPQAQG